MTDARIDRSEIGTVTELASGGEGTVYSIAERPGMVYKEYLGDNVGWKPNEAGFNALRRALDGMSPTVRNMVLERTAWPETAVFDSGNFVGVLMRRIPTDFMCEKSIGKRTKTSVRDCNFLIFPDYLEKPAIRYDFAAPSRSNLIEITRQYVDTMCVLHRHDIVVGDVSGSNMAWREHEPGVILVDCDSFSTTTTRPISPEKETPDWEDPLPHVGTNHLTDSYKMGLMVFRLLTGGETNRPNEADFVTLGAKFPEFPGVAEVVRRSVGAKAATARPHADEWLAAMDIASATWPTATPNAPSSSAASMIWCAGDAWYERQGDRTVRLLRIPALTLPLVPCTIDGESCWCPDPADPGLTGQRVPPPAAPSGPGPTQTAPDRKFRPIG